MKSVKPTFNRFFNHGNFFSFFIQFSIENNDADCEEEWMNSIVRLLFEIIEKKEYYWKKNIIVILINKYI